MELKKRSLGGLLLTLCLTAMYLIVGVGPANATGKFDYPGAISDVNVTFNGKDGGQARVDDEVKVTAK